MDKETIKLAIFSNDKDKILEKYIIPLETIVIKNKSSNCNLLWCEIIDFEFVARNYSKVLEMIKDKLVILYDIDKLYKYDTTLTRFFVNIASKETNKKIVCGNSMINKNNYDVFSYYFFLDKKILGVNHYWCFKANHYILDDKPVKMLDEKYIAKRVKDYTIFDIEPKNDLEREVKNEIISSNKCI